MGPYYCPIFSRKGKLILLFTGNQLVTKSIWCRGDYHLVECLKKILVCHILLEGFRHGQVGSICFLHNAFWYSLNTRGGTKHHKPPQNTTNHHKTHHKPHHKPPQSPNISSHTSIKQIFRPKLRKKILRAGVWGAERV